MSKTRIEQLAEFGQSIWLDSISRAMIETGKLKEMIRQGLRGITSNPTIFDKAISSGDDYDKKTKELSNEGKSVFEICDELTVRDVQDASDMLIPVYRDTQGLDGYVSLEINPKLAFKTQETIEEGKRLYKKVNRINVMFKVPGTNEGFRAIEELIACGINVNVTLIFSSGQYINAAQAYLRGIRRILLNNVDASRLRSVASVFVSRIDTAVDNLLEEKIVKEKDREKKIQPSVDVTESEKSVRRRLLLQHLGEVMQGPLHLDRLLHTILTCVTSGYAFGFNRAMLFLINKEHNVLKGKLAVVPSSPEKAVNIWQEISSKYSSLKHVLEQQRLISAEKLAAIGSMASYITHEIRNPLVTIGGFANSLSHIDYADSRIKTTIT